MKDEEIIKALEICLDETIEDGHCKSCPCKDACYGEEGIHALEKAALDLIKRQQGRMERLKDNLDAVLKERTDLVVDRVVERLSNNYRIVHSDEDLEWNRAITKAIEVVREGE